MGEIRFSIRMALSTFVSLLDGSGFLRRSY